jgi:hypothetical protein
MILRAPSIQEVSAIIRKLKNDTDLGEDSITVEFIKGGSGMLWRKIHILYVLMQSAECGKNSKCQRSGIVPSHAHA